MARLSRRLHGYWLLKYIFLGPLLAILGRPKIEGLEHVPQSGPAILASNHLAVMDSFYLPLVVRRRITFLAKSEYFTGTGFKGWLSRWFFTAVGQVPIDRSSADAAQAALDTAERVLGEGKLLGMYPEGTRSPDGRLYKGKTGLARLALETGVPVIPVAMIGTNKVNPPGTSMLRFGKVTVRFGKPMDFSRFDGSGGQPLHRTRRHRRGDLRTDGAFRSGIRRHLRRDAQERQRLGAVGPAIVVADSADGRRVADQLTADTGAGAVDGRGAGAVAAPTATVAPAATRVASAHHR